MRGGKIFPKQKSPGVKSSQELKRSFLHPQASTESPWFIFGPSSPKTESYFLQELLLKGWCFEKGAHFYLVHAIGRSGPFCCIQVDLDYQDHMKIGPDLRKQILIYPTSGHC